MSESYEERQELPELSEISDLGQEYDDLQAKMIELRRERYEVKQNETAKIHNRLSAIVNRLTYLILSLLIDDPQQAEVFVKHLENSFVDKTMYNELDTKGLSALTLLKKRIAENL